MLTVQLFTVMISLMHISTLLHVYWQQRRKLQLLSCLWRGGRVQILL